MVIPDANSNAGGIKSSLISNICRQFPRGKLFSSKKTQLIYKVKTYLGSPTAPGLPHLAPASPKHNTTPLLDHNQQHTSLLMPIMPHSASIDIIERRAKHLPIAQHAQLSSKISLLALSLLALQQQAPLCIILMQKKSSMFTIVNKLYQITIHQEHSTPPQHNDYSFSAKYTRLQQKACLMEEEIRKVKQELGRADELLRKERELSYIMSGYFAKIEKIVYNKQSLLFEPPLNYEKIELHMREIVRRLADIHNQKLNAVPVVYRNTNIKTFKRANNEHQ